MNSTISLIRDLLVDLTEFGWDSQICRCLRKKKSKFIFGISVFMVLFLVGGVFISNKVGASSIERKKLIMRVDINYGDTLWSIAEEYAYDNGYTSYEEFIDDVRDINNISGDYLRAGACVSIPFYEECE